MSPALAVRGTGKLGWGNLLASGDFDFITSASGTTVSSLSIDGCFSAGYDHYLVMRNFLGSVAGTNVDVRLRVGGVDASGADYRYQYLFPSGAGVSGARATGQTLFTSALGYAEAASNGFAALYLSNPFQAVRTTGWTNCSYNMTGNIDMFSFVREHDATTSYDGFTVIPASGTITGSIYVYGLAV